jgi:hypothetical protein
LPMVLNPLLQFSPSTLLTVYIDSCIEEVSSVCLDIGRIPGSRAFLLDPVVLD